MLRQSVGFKMFIGIKICERKGVEKDGADRECWPDKVIAILAGYPGVSILRWPETLGP